MRKKLLLIGMIMLLLSITNGCNKSDDDKNTTTVSSDTNNKVDIEKPAEDTNLNYPKIKDVIFPNLHTADALFTKGMPYNYIDFIIYSTKELDIDKVILTCDTTVPYECSITGESDTITSEDLGYALLCAYNGIEITGTSMNDELDFEEYEKITKGNWVKPLYVYIATLSIEVDNLEDSEDSEINNLTITYEDEKYEYNIGSIKINNDYELDYDNYDDSLIWQYGTDYTPLRDRESIYTEVDYILSTTDKEMTIKNLELKNVDWTCDKIIVHIENENGIIETEYDGSEIIIPQNSNVNFEIVYSENCPENYGVSYSPILKIDYDINGEECTFNFMFYVTDTETGYETYAYLFDNIDIYNLYQKNK